jgi:CRP/FNR family nitrogen fixation transcriptional regulator
MATEAPKSTAAEPAEYIYQVVDGAVRSHKLLSTADARSAPDWRIFGLENGAEHRFTAEAIVDTTVRLTKRSALNTSRKAMSWLRSTF